MAALATALAAALRERGVPGSTARLAAESAVTVFGVAFGKWIAEDEERSFLYIQREVLDELVMITADGRICPDTRAVSSISGDHAPGNPT